MDKTDYDKGRYFGKVVNAASLTTTEVVSNVNLNSDCVCLGFSLGGYIANFFVPAYILLKLSLPDGTIIFSDFTSAAALVGEHGENNPFKFPKAVNLRAGDSLVYTYKTATGTVTQFSTVFHCVILP